MNMFYLRSRIFFGEDALAALKDMEARNVTIITDEFLAKNGVADRVASMITGAREVRIFSEIRPDPPIDMIAKALAFLLESDTDTVVAVGGGSSIDAAKATVLMYEQKVGRDVKLVAIPTTSGTGSEVTRVAVVTDPEAGKKYPLFSEALLPNAAILSGDLTVSVPPAVTAHTGFDVITHALEAYVSVNANDFTDAFAEKALELAFTYLPVAYRDGENRKAREKMQTASCLAGMAFNDAGLGVNHGIAHALGAVFHLPHGMANAMLLYHVMRYNAELDTAAFAGEPNRVCNRLARIARFIHRPAYTKQQGARNLLDEIKRLTVEMKIPQTLGEAGVSRTEYERMREHIVESALRDACTATNPRKPDANAIRTILRGIERF